jgi:hypothetical protein
MAVFLTDVLGSLSSCEIQPIDCMATGQDRQDGASLAVEDTHIAPGHRQHPACKSPIP